MVDYILGDRGSVKIVTDGYYEAETLQVFEELHIDRERIWFGEAHLVPEPDNPYEPNSIAVYIDDLKIGRMNVADSASYWEPITRVVASGYVPVVQLQLSAIARRIGGATRIESYGVLSLSAPGSLFPLNQAPARAALLPQGQSMKVLDEKDHSEYLHSILPDNGEGRVILTLEVNQTKLPDGRSADTVEVFHDRKMVGRLSTQMSDQLAPVIKYAYDRNRLTSAWGTIRGNSLELSLTVQAVRAREIPAEWYRTLPNNVPELLPESLMYEVPDAYVATDGEKNRALIEEAATKKRRGFMSALTGTQNGPATDTVTISDVEPIAPAPTPAPAGEAPVQEEEEPEITEPADKPAWVNITRIAGACILLLGIILAFIDMLTGIVAIVIGGGLFIAATYAARRTLPDDELVDYEEQTQS